MAGPGEPAEPASPLVLGPNFRDAAIAALEEARRGLVWEHERVLASREADLRNEIGRLQQELSLYFHQTSDGIKDLSTVRSQTETIFGQTSDGIQDASTALAETEVDFHHMSEGNPDSLVDVNARKSFSGGEGSVSHWGSSARSMPDASNLNMESNDCPLEAHEVFNFGKQPLAGQEETGWCWTSKRQKTPEKEEGEGGEGRDRLEDSREEERTRRLFARTSARRPHPPAEEPSNSQPSSTQQGPATYEDGESMESLMTTSTASHKVTWRRSASTVILQAGSDFFHEHPDEPELINHNKGWFELIGTQDRHAQIRLVETVMGFVIVLNTMTLGISSELLPDSEGWIVVDSVFAGIFTFELFWKLFILGIRGFYCGAEWRWNIFEFILVVLAWVEVASAVMQVGVEENPATTTSKSSLFRMLRLMRLAKLLRILRLQIFCDLLMMVNGAIGSWKTLLYSMVLIFIPLYGVSLVLKETLGTYAAMGEGAEGFEHLISAFFTLFRCIVAGECTQEDGKPIFVMVTRAYGWSFGLVYCLVQFFMTFGLFNVIVAIYVENTVSSAKYTDITVKRQRLRDRTYFEGKAQELLKLIWRYHFKFQGLTGAQLAEFDEESAGRMQLTQDFFEQLLVQQSFTDLLRDLDISDDDQMDLFETLDVEGAGTIDLLDFIVGIGKLRGEARKADVVAVGLILRSLQHRLTDIEKLHKQRSVGKGRDSDEISPTLRRSSCCAELPRPCLKETVMPYHGSRGECESTLWV